MRSYRFTSCSVFTHRVVLGIALAAVVAIACHGLRAAEAPATAAAPPGQGGSIEVDMVGDIKTGVVAIGGETTGATITSLGMTWELNFQGNKENADRAVQLNGHEANVKGTLTVKAGIEVKTRVIVIVKEIKPLTN